ncbi:hypothetical protein [Tateyamaria sp. ANG-S1]|uniref:hypothetical protein n=1 Tax=Tateyamaria sp. ANG-S1 TaxID=1577905 RepID=UPI00057E6EF9|nr:hypothetical protein [Tateyamaria sp. ANG-S1]KIC47742.1 hypothetical protein RA29_19200 [Tateyamaria sp. ANG-S1]
MKWKKLSKQQRAFLINYIRPDPGITLFGKAARDVNKRIINDFGDYEAERRNLNAAIDAIPTDHTEVRQGPIDNLRTAELMAQDGDFTGASGVLRAATQNAAAALAHIQNEAQRLLGYVATFPLPQGVTLAQSDLDKMAAARLQVQNLLAAATPTKADLEAAQDAYQTYMDIGLEALQTMGDVAAADTLVQNAWNAHGTYVQAMGNADYGDLAGTTQYNALTTLVNDAQNLEAEYLGRRPQDWEEARNVAAALNAFGAARADHDALKNAAIAELATAQRVVYDAFAPAIRTGANVDLTRYPNGPDLAGMTTLRDDLQNDIAHIEGTLGGTDVAALTALTAYIPQASRRAIDMAAKIKEAELQLLREQMTAEHGRPAHIEAILTLKETNPDAGQAVLDGIAANTAKLNGEMANSQFINDRWVELKALENTLAGHNRDADAIFNRAENRRINDIEPRNAELADLYKKWFPSKTEKERMRQLEGELAQLMQQQRVDAGQLNAKNGQINATQTQIAAKAEIIKAGEDQRALFDAITFGPLSPNATHPLPPVKVKEMIELFGKAPDIATRTCKLVANAENVDALVDTALFLGDQVQDDFAYQAPGTQPPPAQLTPQESKAYAQSLLERTAYLGQQFANDAQAAITAGVHMTKNPVIDPDGDEKANIAARAAQAADAMMQPGPGGTVTLDVTSPAFTNMLAMQKFSVSGTVAPSTMQTKEIEKLQAVLSDPAVDPVTGMTNKQRAEAVLNNVAVPADANARDLLTQSLGIPAADFDDPTKVAEIEQKMRTAILKSMVTPVAQANVGSCFATSGLLNLKEQDPMRVMEMYGELANSGTFTPRAGAVVPAITNLPPGDDPLSRSLEYSIATASARLAQSKEKQAAFATLILPIPAKGPTQPARPAPFDTVTAALTTRGTDSATLQGYLLSAFCLNATFEYDPTEDADLATDGSSDQGIMFMYDKTTGQKIDTEAKFISFLEDQIDAVLATGDPNLDPADAAIIKAACSDPAFLAGMNARHELKAPWKRTGGGYGEQTAAVLHGTAATVTGTTTPMAPAPVVLPGTPAPSATVRSTAVLKGIADHTAGGAMTMIGVRGNHSFNAVPHTPEMQALMVDPPGVDANVGTILVGPGNTIADNPIAPLEKTVHLFEMEMQRIIASMPTPEIADMVRINMLNRPPNPMTPAELHTHIETQMVAAHDAIAQLKADEWRQKQIDKGNPAPNNARMQQVKAFYENVSKNEQEAQMAGAMVEELGAPKVVIADSNWGDANDHQNFVIASNPLTGELQMFSQSVVTGKMKRMGDDWLNADWAKEE